MRNWLQARPVCGARFSSVRSGFLFHVKQGRDSWLMYRGRGVWY